jgi:ABC-type multidrug transport system fused ATPase/permease subunit
MKRDKDQNEDTRSHSDLTEYSRLTHSTQSIEEEQDISLWTAIKFVFSFTSPKLYVVISMTMTIVSALAFASYTYPEIYMILGYTKFDNDELKDRESYCVPALFGIAMVVCISIFFEKMLIMQTSDKMVTQMRGNTYESLMKQPTEFYDKPSHASGNLTNVLASEILEVNGAALEQYIY